MTKALLSALATTAATALLFACTTDGSAPNALSAATAAAATEQVAARPAPATIDNFMLSDTDFMGHELYRMTDAKAIVIVTTGNGCPIARNLTPHLKALKAKYGGQGVQFLLLNSNLQDGRDAIAAEKADFGIDIPVLMDRNQLVGEQLGVTRTAEFFVIDPKTWKIAYRGPMDDRMDYGTQKANADHPWASDAIEAVLAGRPAMAASRMSPGCLIDFPERAKVAATRISYVKDVAPILEKKCVACHVEGGIGPFAMTNYEMVKGFSPMIREVLRTDRMPPWNVDAHVSKFADDKSLTPAEIKTVVHWVEQGSPRGEGVDPLGAKRRVAAKWPLGKPDLVLDIPQYTIPASGVVDYQRPIMGHPLTAGPWVKASSFVGTFLPPGGAVGAQVHYTPFGKEVTDKSQLGLYFYKKGETPDLVMRNSVIVDPTIVLPAGEARHKETAYIDVPKDMLLYSAFPHAHYRGYASDLWVEYPDGAKKRLLAMPRYDFNWQREYSFAEPLKIPAGSKLIANYWYDNSKQNPANPDASKTIVWGDQSWEEMFYTALRYRWTEETSAKLTDNDELIDKTRMMGMFDDNVDGRIQKAELKGEMGNQIVKYFVMVDKDKDGAIDKTEFAAMQAMMGGRRRDQAQQAPAAAPAATATKSGSGS